MIFNKQSAMMMVLLPAMIAPAFAKEHPMGPAQEVQGMEIAAVYLQPITMDKDIGLPAAQADAHIEVDIHATKDNANTFSEGWWIPYLTVSYELDKIDNRTKQVLTRQSGVLMPMIADDGPHYGSNIKFLGGPGLYKITYHIAPPSDNPNVLFGRHIDKETAAPPWFKPFNATWEFPWAGPGEKGSY